MNDVLEQTTPATLSRDTFCAAGKQVLQIEADAILALHDRIDDAFAQACQTLLRCEGRVVVTGMGKSGHIGSKIAATFASTGTPAFFVHPAEASHGDLGMIITNDVVLAISHSGKTDEILTILPNIKRNGIPLIAMTGDPQSPLAKTADIHLDISVPKEACSLGLAPTSSTTASLVMGDALAISVLEARGFTRDDFARHHPAGTLGRRLILRVEDIMHQGDDIPISQVQDTISQALVEVTAKRLGITVVLDKAQKLFGIFTDGDLRRALDGGFDIHSTPIYDVCTTSFKSISPETLAAEALRIMESHKITTLIVTRNQSDVIGVVHLHDILQAGVV